jgi:hypothetical protein
VDDVAGNRDWTGGVLTYDFRYGAVVLGITNRLDMLRGKPAAVIVSLESDGGGQRLTLRLRDSAGQYFESSIVQLSQPGIVQADRLPSAVAAEPLRALVVQHGLRERLWYW